MRRRRRSSPRTATGRTLEGADTGGQDFKEPAGLFTIADFGGWADVTTKFFDAEKGIVTEIERNLGVSVEK